ncbi:MAG: MFS transporter [Ilumatobacter sp.]
MAFSARGRSIGVFETSWAIALLVGAPTMAVLISWFGWRGPFVALAIGSFVAALAVFLLVAPGEARTTTGVPADGRAMARSAWYPMIASAATAAAGLGVFVVSGAWLDDVHGVSTGGLGVIAAGLGAVELMSSSGVAAIGDRVGSRRSVQIGLVVLASGLVVMSMSGDLRSVAIVGLVVFLGGFEFGFVSSLTMVTEAAPHARGRAIGISNACGTVARAGAVVASGQLYESFGIGGSITLAIVAAAFAFVMTTLTVTPEP